MYIPPNTDCNSRFGPLLNIFSAQIKRSGHFSFRHLHQLLKPFNHQHSTASECREGPQHQARK